MQSDGFRVSQRADEKGWWEITAPQTFWGCVDGQGGGRREGRRGEGERRGGGGRGKERGSGVWRFWGGRREGEGDGILFLLPGGEGRGRSS